MGPSSYPSANAQLMLALITCLGGANDQVETSPVLVSYRTIWGSWRYWPFFHVTFLVDMVQKSELKEVIN